MPWIIALILTGLWSWPMSPARITSEFDPPEHQWAAGHRGIDLAARPGDLIRSIGPGRVAYVGVVAGTPVVAIDHPGMGLRSTYQPVAALVSIDEPVGSGALIGRLAEPPAGSGTGGGGHCAGRCLHLGIRGTAGYVDPLTVLPRPTAILKPVSREPRAIPVRALTLRRSAGDVGPQLALRAATVTSGGPG